MKTLKQWYYDNSGSLIGEVYTDPRFKNGTVIKTTRVIDLQGNIATTLSGTEYLLSDNSYFYSENIKKIQDSMINKAHLNLVERLVKNPKDIQDSLSPIKVDMIHAILGISGEAGELLDAIKKHVIYNKPMDRANVVEELGDLEFYLAQFRNSINITREEVLSANIAKLEKRYPSGYTDSHAAQRLDKVGE